MGGFRPSQLVRLQGLTNTAYNGKLAWVQTPLGDSGRHNVELHASEDASSPAKKRMQIKPEHMVHACMHCHQSGVTAMKFCGKCQMATYCSAECQRSDWNRHKEGECTELRIMRNVTKSPIMVAAGMGRLHDVERLVEQGTDVNLEAGDGMPPLHLAVQNGHLAIVQYLVQKGADKNKTTTDGCTPLHLAAQRGNLAIVQYLIQQGADKDKATTVGLSPLHWAAQKGHLAIVRYLVQQGADKNKAGSVDHGARHVTPLMVATEFGHLEVATYLRDQGAV